jgi:c-di-AMP phosphodiesterase-like protein
MNSDKVTIIIRAIIAFIIITAHVFIMLPLRDIRLITAVTVGMAILHMLNIKAMKRKIDSNNAKLARTKFIGSTDSCVDNNTITVCVYNEPDSKQVTGTYNIVFERPDGTAALNSELSGLHSHTEGYYTSIEIPAP